MKRHSLHDFFLPHERNNYRPHVLHRRRTIVYGLLAVVVKVIVVVFALSVPSQAYLLPDILKAQAQEITLLTNASRVDKHLPPLKTVALLTESADDRATDMAANQYFSHSGANGHTLQYFMKLVKYPYRVAGENLAVGFTDAASVVNAWIKSPSHYANLVDTDYSEFGIGVAAGYYQGHPTVYIAQHFGDPLGKRTPKAYTETATTTSLLPSNNQLVLGTKISANPETIFIDDTSRVFWQEVQPRAIRLIVVAKIKGAFKSAVVEIQNYQVALQPVPGRLGELRGELMVYESADDLFKNLILPTLMIEPVKGDTVRATIDWYNPKIVGASPLEKYIRAKSWLGPITNFFSVTRGFYLAMIVFFSLMLLLSIAWEIKKQHYYSIVETILLISLVAILWWV